MDKRVLIGGVLLAGLGVWWWKKHEAIAAALPANQPSGGGGASGVPVSDIPNTNDAPSPSPSSLSTPMSGGGGGGASTSDGGGSAMVPGSVALASAGYIPSSAVVNPPSNTNTVSLSALRLVRQSTPPPQTLHRFVRLVPNNSGAATPAPGPTLTRPPAPTGASQPAGAQMPLPPNPNPQSPQAAYSTSTRSSAAHFRKKP
jgi:hypothetical protein